MVAGVRAIQRHAHRSLRRGLFDLRRFAVVGADQDAIDLKARLLDSTEKEYDFVGYVSPAGAVLGNDMSPFLGGVGDIGNIVDEYRIGEVFVCDKSLPREAIGRIVMDARSSGAEVRVVSGITDMLIRGSLLEDIAGVPVVVFPPVSLSGTRLVIKYISDFACALLAWVGLVLLAPIVFVYQGLSHRNYAAWVGAAANLGMVLSGKRSLVGPMHWVGGERVKPGITGMWLISTGRSMEAPSDRFDLYYLQNWSLSFDIEIMLLSIRLVGRLFRSARSGRA
jgi:hypothetical protein